MDKQSLQRSSEPNSSTHTACYSSRKVMSFNISVLTLPPGRGLAYGHAAWRAGGLNVPQGLHEGSVHLDATIGDREVLHTKTSWVWIFFFKKTIIYMFVSLSPPDMWADKRIASVPIFFSMHFWCPDNQELLPASTKRAVSIFSPFPTSTFKSGTIFLHFTKVVL